MDELYYPIEEYVQDLDRRLASIRALDEAAQKKAPILEASVKSVQEKMRAFGWKRRVRHNPHPSVSSVAELTVAPSPTPKKGPGRPKGSRETPYSAVEEHYARRYAMLCRKLDRQPWPREMATSLGYRSRSSLDDFLKDPRYRYLDEKYPLKRRRRKSK